MVLFLVTLTSPRSHSGSAADGETGEEAEANIPCSHNSRCGAYDVAGEEADESSCKAVALCVDVEVAEREGAIAVVEEAVLKMDEDDADWPATTMAARCWGRSARATTTVARDGATPSILHGEVARRREKTRSAA